ncbi:kinetochore protein NUF2 homolog [Hibiscus syriacus]|uniref:kinetochore protein NUF2 homolog n=1 Tax=Hibiscus syriacus TaxID=106335 RepID=UPI00192137CB|nr:kinetochore protein NUF2 homolog [Hibiscus syriacus]
MQHAREGWSIHVNGEDIKSGLPINGMTVISQAEFDLVQSVQENANLRPKIVQSPDKIQRALEEKKLTRDEAKNAERSAMQSFQQKTATVEVYSKEFNNCIPYLLCKIFHLAVCISILEVLSRML